MHSYANEDPDDNEPTRMYTPGSAFSKPPPAREEPARTSPRAAPRPARAPNVYASVPPPRAPTRSKLGYGLLAAVVVAVVAIFLLQDREGALVLTVAGPGGKALDGVKVFIDGEKRCDSSPCKIEGLAPGPHMVRASADGYQPTADQAVNIEAGQHNTHNVLLSKATGTGIKVSAKGSGLELYVDGEHVGALPQTLREMEPGDHLLKIAGNSRYEPWEKTVTVEPERMLTLGPVELKVLKGLATIKAGPGADGARVLLDGRLIPKLPATIEIPTGKTHTLIAKKDGYATYRRSIRFDDGIAEKTFEITMVEGGSEERETERRVVSRRRVASSSGRSRPAAKSTPAAGQATLNMNSIPVSNVILNGRPLGATPKVGVRVAPGPQTVVFVHPEHGRKVQSATVTAGATKTFMARFP